MWKKVKITAPYYTRIQCVKGGGVWGHRRREGLRQIKHLSNLLRSKWTSKTERCSFRVYYNLLFRFLRKTYLSSRARPPQSSSKVWAPSCVFPGGSWYRRTCWICGSGSRTASHRHLRTSQQHRNISFKGGNMIWSQKLHHNESKALNHNQNGWVANMTSKIQKLKLLCKVINK